MTTPAFKGCSRLSCARNGFAVDCAPNGRQAFEYLRRGSYAVILLDLMMPEVNGFELLERIERTSPALLGRVIVMTGASQRVLEDFHPSRVWGLIRKPFDIDEFLAGVVACAQGEAKSGVLSVSAVTKHDD